MNTSNTTINLNNSSLSAHKKIFRTLKPPEIDSLKGTYQAQFTGPLWLRLSAPHALSLGGLKNWKGKIFFPEEVTPSSNFHGYNLVLRDNSLATTLPFSIDLKPSSIDNEPSIHVIYNPPCRFPWMHMTDEIRLLSNDCLLGMTYTLIKPLHRFPFPFLLFRQQRDEYDIK